MEHLSPAGGATHLRASEPRQQTQIQIGSDQDKEPFRRKTIRDRNCCRKKKGVAIIGLIVEVWCTLGGRPIWVRGPFVGSQHDGKSFQGIDCLSVETAGKIDAEESGGDSFLCDKGYVGCNHVPHEYKKLPGQLLSMAHSAHLKVLNWACCLFDTPCSRYYGQRLLGGDILYPHTQHRGLGKGCSGAPADSKVSIHSRQAL
jgi:hypothetical protein